MKLALIGTGKIIADALYALEAAKGIEKTAIFARAHSREKAESLAQKYGIRAVYTDYRELLEHSEADTVYIGLINSAHYPYAKEALLHGKNVILEKPFTGFYQEALELAELARRQQLFLFEAVTILHNPVLEEMKKQLGRLGKMRMFLANYSQYSSRYEEYLAGSAGHAFDPAYYGGALFDINVYNIHYCVSLFGRPLAVAYYPNQGFNGIDTSGTLVMKYEGFSAVCTGAKDSDSPGFVSLQGEKGWMRIEGKPNVAEAVTISCVDGTKKETVRDAAGAVVRAAVTETFRAPARHHRMTQEFEDFARMIDGRDHASAEEYLEETLAVMEVLEKARENGGIIF